MLRVAFDPVYDHPLPQGHRFPMAKYTLLAEQLIYEGTLQPEQFFRPQALDEAWILQTHTADYWQSLKEGWIAPRAMRKIGFPYSPQLIHRSRTIAQGTIDCALHALKHQTAALNIAGGTHHAYSGHGEGFCLLNDIAIAANYLLAQNLVRRILIIDLDVHQGNGTAKIFEQEPRVFTFSMHGAKNYPLHKERSDLDVPLADGLSDGDYLRLLDYHLQVALEAAQPDFVFYLSGVDVLAGDKLGRLALSLQGCRERDYRVFACCKRLALPVAVSMGGGYAPQLARIINAHANTYRVAAEWFD